MQVRKNKQLTPSPLILSKEIERALKAVGTGYIVFMAGTPTAEIYKAVCRHFDLGAPGAYVASAFYNLGYADGIRAERAKRRGEHVDLDCLKDDRPPCWVKNPNGFKFTFLNYEHWIVSAGSDFFCGPHSVHSIYYWEERDFIVLNENNPDLTVFAELISGYLSITESEREKIKSASDTPKIQEIFSLLDQIAAERDRVNQRRKSLA